MFKKPTFWILFVVLGILSCVFIYHNGYKAFSFLDVKTTMDRNSSLQAADSLQKALGISLKDYRQATIFYSDWSFQNYVELKAGGKTAFIKTIHDGIYQPYKWQVRHFKENTVHEVEYYFTPTGQPYGFYEKLAKTDKGAALSSQAARAIADSNAINIWKIKLSDFNLIETSQDVKPSGRIDHTFVYELRNAKIGEAHYRLRLVVSGDKLTQLQHFVKVPDSFFKEYEEMRSANSTIASIGSAVMLVFYLAGGLIFIFLFLKRKFLIWKQPLFWAGFIGVMSLLAQLNQFSFYWWSYDTSLSVKSFLSQQIVMMIFQTVLDSILVFISLMLAEALTRQAFPQHIQLWKLWNKDTAATPTALGQTLGGYLMVPLFIGYIVLFYLVTVTKFGWWQPASTLSDPNILGSYFTWLSPLAMALHAGFWEEALFRAVPLAAMAIIGTRFGMRKQFIIIGMVLQAIVFGSLHASYATQPAYGRVVELIIPALVFGLIYLRFGLLAGILMHFVYDAVLMNMSAFFTQVPGIWIDRIIFILLLFIPVWIILYRRLQAKRWLTVPAESYNSAWQTSAVVETETTELPEEPETPESPETVEAVPEILPTGKKSKFNTRSIILITIALLLCLMLAQSRVFNYSLHPRLKLTAHQAVVAAQKALTEKYHVQLPPEMKAYPAPLNSDEEMRLFVLENGTLRDFKVLWLRKFLNYANWQVTFQRFKGTLDERTEKYIITLNMDGSLKNASHIIAEDIPGKTLTEDEARLLAGKELQQQFHLNASSLKAISAKPTKQPKRMDWYFVWQDTTSYPLKVGQARISVTIQGDKIAGSSKYVYIPEPWERDYFNNVTITQTNEIACGFLMILFVLMAVTICIVQWSKKRFDYRTFLIVGAVSFVALLITKGLGFNVTIGEFSTIEPFGNQMITAIIGSLVQALFLGAFAGLLNGFTSYWHTQRQLSTPSTSGVYMLIPILLLALLFQTPLGKSFSLAINYHLPDFNAANVYLGSIYIWLTDLSMFFVLYGLLQFLMYFVNLVTRNNTRHNWLKVLILLGAGMINSFFELYKYNTPNFFHFSLLSGLIFGLALWMMYEILISQPERIWRYVILVIVVEKLLAQAYENAFAYSIPSHIIAALLLTVTVLVMGKAVKVKVSPELP